MSRRRSGRPNSRRSSTRRSSIAGTARSAANSNQRKISATLLEFAQPVLDLTPPDATAEDVEQRLKVVVLVWNTVVVAQAGQHEFLAGLRTTLKNAGTPDMPAFIDMLIDRKKEHFGHDHRLIGEFSVRRATDGTFTIRAEARSLGP